MSDTGLSVLVSGEGEECDDRCSRFFGKIFLDAVHFCNHFFLVLGGPSCCVGDFDYRSVWVWFRRKHDNLLFGGGAEVCVECAGGNYLCLRETFIFKKVRLYHTCAPTQDKPTDKTQRCKEKQIENLRSPYISYPIVCIVLTDFFGCVHLYKK